MITLAEVAAFLAAFARVVAFLYAFPLTGDRMLPARVRLAAAALIALALAPSRAGVTDLGALVVVAPGEMLLGLLAGFAARIVFAGAEAGGQLIGLQLGLGFAGMFDPAVAEQELPTRKLVRVITFLAFLATGGLQASIAAVARPPATSGTIVYMLLSVIERSGDVMVAAVRLSAPTLVASVVAYLAAALASRAAPALNVFSVALALVLCTGGLVLLASGPAITAELVATAGRVAEAVAP